MSSMLSQQVAAAKPPVRAKSNQDLAGQAAAAANSAAATNTATATGAAQAAAPAAKKLAPQPTASTPISIGGSKTPAKVEKKVPQMAFSAPVSRPPPPRAPTQRPRVPSCDPPPMALPPSPLLDAPVMGTPAIPTTPTATAAAAPNVSAPVAVGGAAGSKDAAAAKPKKQSISRSLTIYSSSVPNVSFMHQAGAAAAVLYPAFAPVTEGRPVDEPATVIVATTTSAGQPNSATSINSATSSASSTAANSPTPAAGGNTGLGGALASATPSNTPNTNPSAAQLGAVGRRKSGLAKEDELLAAVGSPTIFSMLRFDADVRRKNSITDGKLPVLGTSLKKAASPQQLQAGGSGSLTADGKKKLSESKTQKDIEAAKAQAAAKSTGATAASGTGAGASQTANANEDDAHGTDPDELQFPIDGGADDDAGDDGGGIAGADNVLDDDEETDPNKPAAVDQYTPLFS